MISHQDEHVGTAQRRQHDGLRNLSRLVDHAVVESSVREKRVLDAQARAANNPINRNQRHDTAVGQRGKTGGRGEVVKGKTDVETLGKRKVSILR